MQQDELAKAGKAKAGMKAVGAGEEVDQGGEVVRAVEEGRTEGEATLVAVEGEGVVDHEAGIDCTLAVWHNLVPIIACKVVRPFYVYNQFSTLRRRRRCENGAR